MATWKKKRLTIIFQPGIQMRTLQQTIFLYNIKAILPFLSIFVNFLPNNDYFSRPIYLVTE